jgi:hypothetical protein
VSARTSFAEVYSVKYWKIDLYRGVPIRHEEGKIGRKTVKIVKLLTIGALPMSKS